MGEICKAHARLHQGVKRGLPPRLGSVIFPGE